MLFAQTFNLEWNIDNADFKNELPQQAKNPLKQARSALNELIKEGYLTASIDSIVKVDSLSYRIDFYIGSKYERLRLSMNDSVDRFVRFDLGLGNKKLSNLTPSKYALFAERIIEYHENRGCPFVSVRLLDVVIDENLGEISGLLKIDKGPKIKFGQLILKGSDKFNKKLIEYAIDFESNNLYDQSLIDNIPNRLSQFSFLKLQRDVSYEIYNNKCDVYLYLQNKSANSFDAILGILPKQDGGVNITGDVKLNLVNQFKSGEEVRFNWRKLLPLTQSLDISLKLPYFLKSKVSLEPKFDLYKKDTSFLNLNAALGIGYRLNKHLDVVLKYTFQGTNLIPNASLENATRLPNILDANVNYYGASILFNNSDFPSNPRKGWDIRLSGDFGFKAISKNILFADSLYADINLRSNQVATTIHVERFLSIGKRNVFAPRFQGAAMVSDNLLQNELFRLGGLRNALGFDDESIFASTYGIATMEYRFLLNRDSRIFAFGQYIYTESMTINSATDFDRPRSFGAGVNYATNSGVFSIIYAVGAQRDNPLLIRSAKIHLGFVNYF